MLLSPRPPFPMNENRVSEMLYCCFRVGILFVVNKQRASVPGYQDFPVIVWHKASDLSAYDPQAIFDFSRIAILSALQSSSKTCSKITARSSRLLHTEIKMNSNLDVGGQSSVLAISAINLNAESHQDTSFLSYYRVFSAGKPVTEFCCKACGKELGNVAPEKCHRCRPFVENLRSYERKVVGFVQLPNGDMVGEYLVSANLFILKSCFVGTSGEQDGLQIQ